MLKFQCLFEESKLFLCGRPTVAPTKQQKHVNFANEEKVNVAILDRRQFLCLMAMDFFDLEVSIDGNFMLCQHIFRLR